VEREEMGWVLGQRESVWEYVYVSENDNVWFISVHVKRLTRIAQIYEEACATWAALACEKNI
jgi:hypothetical protein